MTSRTVVILTEPERCELAGADVLMQAVLQLQQLNKAGIAASQTFCDHPAAAMKFIEAYAQAYPELQLRTADLPLPEQLYSIIANGRIMPLQAPTTPQTVNSGEASQLYPLYVLSLGAPDALMRALKHNSFAKSDIKVVEIAPVERSSVDSVSVADAIAHDGRFSWRAERMADSRHSEDDGFASAEWAASDPLKLDGVEVNLDHIQIHRKSGQEDQYDRALDELAPIVVAPPPAVVAPTPASMTTGDAGAGPNGGTNNGSSTAAESPTPTTAVSAAAPEGDAPPSLPAGGISSSVGEASVLPESSATAPNAQAGSAACPAAEGDTPASGRGLAQDDPAAVEADPGADRGKCGATDPGKRHAEPDPESTPAPAESSESAIGARAEVAGRTEGLSFRDPGGDITYRPNASFAIDDDERYPLPAGTGLGGLLGDLFDRSGHGEIVDLDTLFSSLADPPGGSTGALEDLHVRFLGVGGGHARSADDARASRSTPDTPVAPSADRPEADQDDAGHGRLPVIHDLDI